MTQIRSSKTWIVRIYLMLTLSLCILLILALLHINQGMLTFGTVRTRDSRQNDRSQGFRLCEQEELPCCDTYVKVPYQSHTRYSECGSTSAVPVTHYCWVQMYLSVSYVQMPYRPDEYSLQVLKFPRVPVTSMMEMS